MGGVKKAKRKNKGRVAVMTAAIALVALISFFIYYFLFRAKPASERAMEGASTAAQVYYNFLLNGDYRQFLDGRADAAQFPDDYREQLLTAYRQFMAQQQDAHGGIVGCVFTRAAIDSTLGVVQVFLFLSYADSTREEIVVPMVEREGEWKMK